MTLTCMSGMQTLLASWEVYADGAPGATVLRLPGLAAAVFPNEPARAVYNNAVLERIAVLSSVPDAGGCRRAGARFRRRLRDTTWEPWSMPGDAVWAPH